MNLNGLRRLSVTKAAVGVHGESFGETLEPVHVRKASRVVVLCSVALLFLLCGAVSASAHSRYIPTGSFGEAGSGAGQLSLTGNSGVAINDETGDLYVADTGNNRVDEFEANGKFVRAWGWGVENGAAELQTCTTSCQKGLSGTAPGELEAPASIAIDSSPGGNGDVYVANTGQTFEEGFKKDFSSDIISKFDSEGKLIENWGVKGQLDETQLETKLHKLVAKPLGPIVSIAVDTSGSLWIASGATNTEHGEEEGLGAGSHVSVFSQGGNFTRSRGVLVFEPEVDWAFDALGNLYLAGGINEIFTYNATSNEIKKFTAWAEYTPGPTGMAVDRAADDIYVDRGDSVERFVAGCPLVGELEACVPLESFGSPELAGGGNLGVDSSSGVVYVVTPGLDGVDVFTPEVPFPPAIENESISAVTGDSATFGVKIDPNGPVTSYRVEYGPTGSYGVNVPTPDGVIGSGFEAQELSAHVQGLAAATVYHYRVVSYNAKGTVYGEDRTFTTQSSSVAGSVLPDGREWELVTPAEKFGSLFFAQNVGSYYQCASACPFVAQASVDGDAMVNLASAPTESEPSGYVKEASVLSTRGADGGWSSQVISPRHEQAAGPYVASGGEYVFFSEDLSSGIISPFGPFTALSPEASESTPYLHADYLEGNVNKHCESACYRPLVTQADTPGGEKFGEETEPGAGCEAPLYICGPTFAAATPDAKYVVLRTGAHLTATPNEAIYGGREPFYYEWGNGELQPLDLLPASEGGEGVGIGAPSVLMHELSDGGSVFFDYDGHLYLHDFAKKESVRLDVAQGVAEPATGDAGFIYASSDGSRVLFSDSETLTEAPGGGIYECQIVENAGVPGCDLKLTSLTSGATSGTLLGGSKDASYMYFDDAGHLIVDHYSNDEWTTTNSPDVGSLSTVKSKIAGLPQEPQEPPSFEISPDGRWLTFMSSEDLTGYDNRDAVSGQPDIEVYIYEADSNKVVCASCNPTGARPVGVEYNQDDLASGSLGIAGEWEAANLPPWTRATRAYEPDVVNFSSYETRFLSDNGRLFFNTRDALVPQDVDGTQDVYEWEPPGVGNCTTSASGFSERSGGCVGLISSGTSAEESAFMDASGSGDDVFFITLTKLVSQDFDNAMDVYDAHECTTQSPCTPPAATVPPACTTGDACKAAPTPQPSIFGAPSSATFSGAGNVAPPGPPAVKKVKIKPLTRAQKLTRALKACAKKRKTQRAGCERAAHKRYGKVANRGKRG